MHLDLVDFVGSRVKRAVAVMLALGVVFASGEVFATTRYWTGAGANAKASTAANWLTDKNDPSTTGAPVVGDDVVFDAAGEGKACTWDIDVALGSWTQNGYTSTVTIQTKFGDSGFTCLNVTGDVDLQSGTWTHTANGSTETYRLNVACGGNFTIGANAEINADAKGYDNAGPGRSNNHSGGSYGGYCDNYNSVSVYGRCYGSIASPINIGSSGPTTSRQGGGSIRLAVTGTLTVDGHVYARGNRTNNAYYSGSGGSVWLTAARLVGAATGRIAADGGLNSSNYFAAGGRVSLCQTGDATDFSAYLGKVTADGARTAAAEETGYKGSPGTIYYELASDGRGKGALVIDAKTATYKRSEFFIAEQDAGFSPKSITLKNGVTLNVFGDGTKGNQTFAFGGKLVMDGTATFGVDKGAILDMRGMTTEMSASGTHTLTVGKDVKILSDNKMTLDAVTMKFNGTGLDWTLGTLVCTNGGGFAVSAANTLDVGLLHLARGASVTSDRAFVLTGDVVMENGATVTHTANTRDTTYSIDWTVNGDMTVKAGAKFTAKGKGYPQSTGPGASTASYVGASHGGWGWNAYYNKAGQQACYGSLTQPTDIGSGNSTFAAAGGGAVRLTVAGDFVNDGLVDADGADGSSTWFNGSGGSVWITAATIAGTGKIESNAHGYNNNTSAASHGLCSGGRVAVWLTETGADFDDYTGVVSAFGAYNGSKAAGPGTVYLKAGDEAANGGTLVISNGMAFASEPTAISANVTDLSVGKLVVAPNSTLKLLDGKVLTVSGDVVNRGTILATSDSGLALVGTGTSTIDGSLTLGIFDCMTPGKTLVFTPGSTLSIVADGRFKIEGAQDNAVTLKSSVYESAWNLVVDPLASASVNVGNVSDCDASGGQLVAAVNSTLTRTTNWSNTVVIYGQLVTWTGASGGSGWLTAANWDVERAPLPSDRICIPATAVQPVLVGDAASLDLTVEEGASLDLAGFNYTVTENLAVAGMVKSAGSPTVTVGGNCDLTGSTFDADDLTLVVAGTGAEVQTLKGGNTMLTRVRLVPGAAGLAVTEGLTAFYLTAEASAERTITFTPGSTLTSRVAAEFASSASSLSLVSKTAGEKWNLVVGGTAKATGVTVSDSSVAGTIICATDSTDDGGNVNWDFGALVPFHWTATATSPAATDAAYVDSTLTAATGDLTVRSLTLKSGAAFTLPKASTLTVTESLVVEDGATATLNGKVSVGGSFQILSGATVTHSQSPNTSTVYTMDVTVAGDFVLEAGGTIDLNGKGYAAGNGPGAASRGGSHAGRGETHNTTMDNTTYGSALWPVKPGSGGASSAGGGAVQLVAAGVARVDGMITANGLPRGDYYPGSGGSIALRAAALLGAGTMTVNGGDVGVDYTGAGGRIAVILTDAGEKAERFAGTMQAYSGKISSATVPYPRGSAGTIYVEEASDGEGRGRVVVDNSATGASRSDAELAGRPRTDYPVMNDNTVANDESKGATWILRNEVNLNITKNAKIGDLWLEGSKPKVYLNGHTLTIRTNRHALGENEAVQIVPGGTVEEPGKIVWKHGFMVIVK